MRPFGGRDRADTDSLRRGQNRLHRDPQGSLDPLGSLDPSHGSVGYPNIGYPNILPYLPGD